MKFIYGYILWFLFIIVPLGLMALWYWKSRKRNLAKFADSALFPKIAPHAVKFRLLIKYGLFLGALACIIIALAGPRFGNAQQKSVKKVADIIVALDVSRSMDSKDVLPSRLDKSKMAISTLFSKLKGDRIGIVVFAGDAYIQLPLTTDYGAGEMFLEAVSTDMLPVQGTAMGAAIAKSRECFKNANSQDRNRAIILITDGENHEDNPVEEAKAAQSEGINVYTLGIGDPKGTPIPVYENNLVTGYKLDQSGSTVVSKLNEQILKEVASAGGGIYVQGNNTVAALERIMKEIEKLDRIETVGQINIEKENRFQLFLFLALLLLLVEYLIAERRSLKKRINRLFE